MKKLAVLMTVVMLAAAGLAACGGGGDEKSDSGSPTGSTPVPSTTTPATPTTPGTPATSGSADPCRDLAATACAKASACGYDYLVELYTQSCDDDAYAFLQNEGIENNACSGYLLQLNSMSCDELGSLVLLYANVGAPAVGIFLGPVP